MTTFKEIRGTDILALSSDPSNPELGQIWYNSSSGTLKGYIFATVNAWSAGGNLNTARYGIGGAGASNTAAIYFGGQIIAPAPSALLTNSESYDGTSWTNTPSLNTARGTQGFGTQTAAIAAGGQAQPNPTASAAVESWNGSAWTSITSKSQATVASTGVVGIQTAGLVFGGATGDGSPYVTATESWNGSAWTSGGSMPGNAGAKAMAKGGAGTQTAALSMGGDNGAGDAGNQVFSYNGTSWSAGTALNTAQRWSGGGGTQTAAICFGGYAPGASGITQLWNGSAWTTSPNSLATARGDFSGCGTQASALAAGGFPGSYPGSGPGASNATEEWTGSQFSTKTVTVS
jgi:hypothetical protein